MSTKIMWRTSTYPNSAEISPALVLHETEKTVKFRPLLWDKKSWGKHPHKEHKETNNTAFFDTFEGAREHVLRHLAKRRHYLTDALKNIKELKRNWAAMDADAALSALPKLD